MKGVITAEDGESFSDLLPNFYQLIVCHKPVMTTSFNLLCPFANNAAKIAVQTGAAGIIVSNHGARQLDYVPATIMALEEVILPALI